MFSWPQLPSISLPASIQRRFLSFILRRSLGHLVRPGQLDPAQIDAQVGSGFVQINNVQLDYDAINEHLTDFPAPLRLEDGSIGKISVRIPWQNLLSNPFSLSLSSLCLTFVFTSHATNAGHHMHAADDLAESVVSVAESFIHDELSEQGNQNLQESLYPEPHSQRQPPGYIDPFLSTEDLDAPHHSREYGEADEVEDYTAPSTQGVSLLATLIERLLAQFEFDASDTSLRFILPQKAEFIIRLGKLTYTTVKARGDSGLPLQEKKDGGETRTVKLSDFTVSIRDLTPPPLPSTPRERSTSPLTSSSDEDDGNDVAMMMSQSIASLPPLPSTMSPGSSMYHSAASFIRDPSPESPFAEGTEPVEEKILSFGTGSEPLILTLLTPPLVVPEVQTGSPKRTDQKPRLQLRSSETIRLTLTVGPVAVALSAVHTRSICHLSSMLAASNSVNPQQKQSRTPSENLFELTLHVKSVTVLLLHPLSPPSQAQDSKIDALEQFFHSRLNTPHLPHISHLRIQLDTIQVVRSGLSTVAPTPSHGTNASRPVHVSNLDPSKVVFRMSLDEVSAFAFFLRMHETSQSWVTSPVLVSDPHLGSQYGFDDSRFPVFDVTDWRDSRAAKLSRWRVRPPPHAKRRSSGGISPPAAGSIKAPNLPAIRARLEPGAMDQTTVFEVDIIPLHLFLDVSLMEGALKFLSVATSISTFSGQKGRRESEQEAEETPPVTPRARGTVWDEDERLRERKRLEALIMEDFSENNVESTMTSSTPINLVVRVALLRVQVRAPSPTAWASKPRSGALIIDVHGLQFMQRENDPPPPKRITRFESLGHVSPRVLVMAEFKGLLAAATLPEDTTATTFLSVMPQHLFVPNSPPVSGSSPAHTPASLSNNVPSVCLRVIPHRPPTFISPDVARSFSLEIQVPSIHSKVSKSTFDGLTFLADDVVQCVIGNGERIAASDASGRSRDPSLIGSRYFIRRTASTGSSESGVEARGSELVVKVFVAEAQATLLIPREIDGGKARPFEIFASDIDFLAEIKPEGKDETVVTVGVMDLNIRNTSGAGDIITILKLTIPRFSNSASKPLLKLRFISVVDNDTAAKESRLKITASGFTFCFAPEYDWVADLSLFCKTPEGAFESVVPSERTKVVVKLTDSSFHLLAPQTPAALVVYIAELDFSTDLIGDSTETSFDMAIPNARVLFTDDIATSGSAELVTHSIDPWKHIGYALLVELCEFRVHLRIQSLPTVNTQIQIDAVKLKMHACADTLSAVESFASDWGSKFRGPEEKSSLNRRPTATSRNTRERRDVFASVDDDAFRRLPNLGLAADMIQDDLPTNPDYLDASFGAAAGLREVKDDDLFEFEKDETASGKHTPTLPSAEGFMETFGGETIRMLDPQGIRVVERHFENIPPEAADFAFGADETKLNLRIRNCDLEISLYDGYDWVNTRKIIEDEVKAIRRRLVKIRQLLANGQVPDDSIEEANTILFNSVYIGLPHETDELEPGALIAVIDEELNDDEGTETGSQSSWQSFKRKPQPDFPQAIRVRGKKLARSRSSRVDFCLTGVQAEIDQFNSEAPLVSNILVTVRNLEILDHIKTSTWGKFLTELRTDFKGNVRETASDMVRVELRVVRPAPELPIEEGRLRAKVLPIKLHVDQDALDFMKKFFSFESPAARKIPTSPEEGLYFQHVEVFPVDIKLDYKPKRVDYKALREGKTIELMNFFHFDGAEITLRHITLSGITGWPRLFETLNDLWTPDVKANQLAEIISGVSPVRSLVNVGSGVADLVLLPIAQYQKDKRVVKGVQKGTTSFVKSTAMEAIKLGARLAIGTQVILEQAESVLGGQGQFRDTVTAEALQTPVFTNPENSDEESEAAHMISKYADQPLDVREGVQTAYKSLAKNLNSAAQTILAVPMEVYERSGNEGPVRAVVRAVPIAVLKPMIGASEAVSKTLFGLHNTIDPEIRHENEAKYKQR